MIKVTWLGQNGFLLEGDQLRLVIDPYLSDFCTKKYPTGPMAHIRNRPIPAFSKSPGKLDACLVTHMHIDHFDPDWLPKVLSEQPEMGLVLPGAGLEMSEQYGIKCSQIIPLDDGECLQIRGIRITAIKEAHETFDRQEVGFPYLGYILSFKEAILFHAGDTVDYEGFAERLKDFKIDIAFLPINGRDEKRKELGFRGNLTEAEAVDLAVRAGIKRVVPMHFGMFPINDGNPLIFAKYAKDASLDIIMPKLEHSFIIDASYDH